MPAAPPAPPDPAAWFDARVRPLAVHGPAGDDATDTWIPVGAPPSEGTLATIEERAAAEQEAPPRVALTWAAGGLAGMAATALTVAAVRDGVVIRAGLERPAGPEGWIRDMRLRDGVVAVGGDHPWSGAPGVGHVPDGVLGRAVAEAVVEVCGPVVAALAARSRRGRPGLWAQVADAVGHAAAAVCAADPGRRHATVIAGVTGVLGAAGAPWPARPVLRSVPAPGGPVMVVHRGSCCLAYRCGADAAYCATCLFRPPGEVAERVVAHAAGA
ncbi:(2Fe-2S)-binding protein [Miltoncostaea oceani]|uniref:(2Fe-2S)-binding protein n=1 Tax=Miltoncostaea oceani TaxID=2843216 RepID=UPI001C3DB696|nr:(2Fe-2S)-binding protein [Miltoncostaea oceani]